MPDRIGRYQVQRRLGSGGFATVWLAEDVQLDTFVAIKVLADNWSDHLDVRARFVEEARILRKADSDRLVRVLDIGELPDGRPYAVLTYADRGTLADRLHAGPLPVAGALALAAEIARGVAVLHQIGIIHRDLKPSNVLFGRDGTGRERVLIADLGLAKAVAHASGFTVAAGSPGYMAPEQGRPGGGIDIRADVYALGAVLFHMLTGAPPGTEPPLPPSARRPEVPTEVDQIVLRALHPDPAQRWPSAAAVAAALDRERDEAGERTVRLPAQLPRHPAPVRRHRRRALFGAAVAVVIAGVTSGADSAVGSTAGQVRVVDISQTISVEVPGEWAGQLQDAGWNPARIGLSAPHAPGLAVSPDLASWREAGTGTPGVFVGGVPVLPTASPTTPDHEGCARLDDQAFSSASMAGTIRRWVRCDGTAVSFSEAMVAVGDAGGYRVFVQIKQADGLDHTNRILSSLQVRP